MILDAYGAPIQRESSSQWDAINALAGSRVVEQMRADLKRSSEVHWALWGPGFVDEFGNRLPRANPVRHVPDKGISVPLRWTA